MKRCTFHKGPVLKWFDAGLVEDITGLARADLYTKITMTNFGQKQTIPSVETWDGQRREMIAFDITLYS